jgi:hypothetical protein
LFQFEKQANRCLATALLVAPLLAAAPAAAPIGLVGVWDWVQADSRTAGPMPRSVEVDFTTDTGAALTWTETITRTDGATLHFTAHADFAGPPQPIAQLHGTSVSATRSGPHAFAIRYIYATGAVSTEACALAGATLICKGTRPDAKDTSVNVFHRRAPDPPPQH